MFRCILPPSSQCHMMLVCDSSYQQNWNTVALQCRIAWLRTSKHRFSFLLAFTLQHWQVFLLYGVKLAQNVSCSNFFFFFWSYENCTAVEEPETMAALIRVNAGWLFFRAQKQRWKFLFLLQRPNNRLTQADFKKLLFSPQHTCMLSDPQKVI